MKIILDFFKRYKKVAIAFSSGVDSTLLAYCATKALGRDATIYTIKTPYMATWEMSEAIDIATKYSFNHKIVEMPIHNSIIDNPPNRCYLCKKLLFDKIVSVAKLDGAEIICDGSNIDDLKDYRPGMVALKELDIESPFIELGVGKAKIREISNSENLSTWNKPAYACLLTRLQYNRRITQQAINQVNLAEEFMHSKGFPSARVRHHGDIARVELPFKERELILEPKLSIEVSQKIKSLGFKFVAIELEGYDMGSLNRTVLNS